MTCLSRWRVSSGRAGIYAGSNLGLYYTESQVGLNDLASPDVFVVLDAVERERKSWVIWQEGQGPDIVIELLSESTAAEDRGRKKRIYARGIKVGLYCLYDPFTGVLEAYVLDALTGDYLPAPVIRGGVATPPGLGLELAVWQGLYEGVEAPWLRWRTPDGNWVPTGEELAATEANRADDALLRAELAEARAQTEAARAQTEAARADRLAARLAALGLDVE